jgi:uncharacterized protein (DUF1501 family)
MKSSRRELLKGLLGYTCGGLIHSMFTPTNSWRAWGEPLKASIGTQPVFILVNMAGGASYNIAPLYDGTYRDKNPVVSYSPETSLPINQFQGFHPSLTYLKTLYDQGDLALLNMVGYPNPNRSHAESTDIWFSGVRAMSAGTGGWASKLTCQLSSAYGGVSLSGSNLLTQGDCNPPRALESISSFGESEFLGGEMSVLMRMTRTKLINDHAPPGSESLTFVKNQIDSIERTLEVLKRETAVELPTVANPLGNNPTNFQRDCRDAASLLAARNLGVRLIYLERGGFDTHAMEKPALTNNLTDMNVGLRYLSQVAQALGRWNDVIIVTMSEFCRTFENGSSGTDHGHSGPMYIFGGGVKGGILSPQPTPQLTAARDYYHDYYVDFRAVFKEVVSGLGLDSARVFPEAHSLSPIGIFK